MSGSGIRSNGTAAISASIMTPIGRRRMRIRAPRGLRAEGASSRSAELARRRAALPAAVHPGHVTVGTGSPVPTVTRYRSAADRRTSSVLSLGDVHGHLGRAPDLLESRRFPLRGNGLHGYTSFRESTGKAPDRTQGFATAGASADIRTTGAEAGRYRTSPPEADRTNGAHREQRRPPGHADGRGRSSGTRPPRSWGGSASERFRGVRSSSGNTRTIRNAAMIRRRSSGSQHHSATPPELPFGSAPSPSVLPGHPFVRAPLTRRTDPCSVTGRCPFSLRRRTAGQQNGQPE